MASNNIGHREARTLDLSNVSSTLSRLRYVDLCLKVICSYIEDYLQPNCSAYNNKFKMAPENIFHREPRTLDPRKLITTLFRLCYGDLCLTILCSDWQDYLQPNCSAYNNKFKIGSNIIGHREPRTLDPRNVNTTLYRLRYGDLCLTIDCSYLEDYLQTNCSACNK